MNHLRGALFNWDDDKNLANIRKHGVSFHEAATVFSDDNLQPAKKADCMEVRDERQL